MINRLISFSTEQIKKKTRLAGKVWVPKGIKSMWHISKTKMFQAKAYSDEELLFDKSFII